jgi:hypothetical protein
MTKSLILGTARYEQTNARVHLDTEITVFVILMGMEQTTRASVLLTSARLRHTGVFLPAASGGSRRFRHNRHKNLPRLAK